MKKIAVAAVAAMCAAGAFAAANDTLISFSTPGPDRYADGRTVLDGERYALVYVTDEDNFAISADGAATGGKVIVAAPVAKNGRCPKVVFEVDANLAASLRGGKWAVYLLDTRTFAKDAEGETVATLSANAKSVNTAGLVGDAAIAGLSGAIRGKAAVADTVAAGRDVPVPQATGIEIVDGYVYVTVKGTVPYLAYGLMEGDEPGNVATPTGEAEPGEAGADDEIILVAPVKGDKGFFKAGRR